MEFRKETVSRITTNAKAAQDVWKEYAHNSKLCESFHLRPTGSGVAIISTLPYAPMRGKTVSPKQLKDELNKIVGRLDALLGVDEDKSLMLMEEWGFKKRAFKNEKSDKFIEENAQAHFIQWSFYIFYVAGLSRKRIPARV